MSINHLIYSALSNTKCVYITYTCIAFQAYSLCKDLYTYRGLVNSFLALSKVGEALRVAKEALQLMPKDPRAVLMVGNVLSMSKDGAPKAIKAYAKVLKLNPQSHDAAIAMADIYLTHSRHDPNSDLSVSILGTCICLICFPSMYLCIYVSTYLCICRFIFILSPRTNKFI
jgi:tetratricopeptide (TPR) repeat protein